MGGVSVGTEQQGDQLLYAIAQGGSEFQGRLAQLMAAKKSAEEALADLGTAMATKAALKEAEEKQLAAATIFEDEKARAATIVKEADLHKREADEYVAKLAKQAQEALDDAKRIRAEAEAEASQLRQKATDEAAEIKRAAKVEIDARIAELNEGIAKNDNSKANLDMALKMAEKAKADANEAQKRAQEAEAKFNMKAEKLRSLISE